MYAQVEKKKDNKVRIVSNSVTQKKSDVMEGFEFGYNQPKTFIQSVLQRYRSEEINGKKAKVSINCNYIVFNEDLEKREELFVKEDDLKPDEGFGIVKAGTELEYPRGANQKYKGYRYNQNLKFTNDCLDFAENLARHTDEGREQAEFDAVDSCGLLFGNSDKENTEVANRPDFAKNELAIPNVGEAYGIVRTVEEGKGRCPYHAACVVAKDDTDRVTLEADASLDLKAPKFEIYGTLVKKDRKDKKSKTFHETYKQYFTTRVQENTGKKRKRTTYYKPATGVLRLKEEKEGEEMRAKQNNRKREEAGTKESQEGDSKRAECDKEYTK